MSDTAWARIARFIVPKHTRGAQPCPPERWREYCDAIGVRAAHGVRVAPPTARLHRLLVVGAQALPTLVPYRHVDQGAHGDTRRG
ncbi:MAG: hypothetical protein K2Q25_11350 [Mycobacteriaceae bacterium]|nr:hypothetical protein [Mycobacteriaceae bacterium]